MRRYTNENQIIKDIDKCYARSRELFREAETLDRIADELFKYPASSEDAKLKREQAGKLRTTANNLVNKKAKKYGEKLSEFRTGTVSFTDDTSVAGNLR